MPMTNKTTAKSAIKNVKKNVASVVKAKIKGKAKKTTVKASATKRGGKRMSRDMKMVVLAKENPRREKTVAFKNWKLYKTGRTIAEYVKLGGLMSKFRTDIRKGHLKVA